jgi:hypothetical protein
MVGRVARLPVPKIPDELNMTHINIIQKVFDDVSQAVSCRRESGAARQGCA